MVLARPGVYLMYRCLSQVGVLSKRTNESSRFLEASFDVSSTVLKGNSSIYKIRVFSFATESHTLDLGNFVMHGMPIVAKRRQPRSTKVGAQRNWTVVGQLSWQYLRRSTASSSHIVDVCLQHNAVARVHLRQLILIRIRWHGGIKLAIERSRLGH